MLFTPFAIYPICHLPPFLPKENSGSFQPRNDGFVYEATKRTCVLSFGIKMGKKKSIGENDEGNKTLDGTMDDEDAGRPPYKDLIQKISVIAKPLASKKLTKKIYKTIKKGNRPTYRHIGWFFPPVHYLFFTGVFC